MVFRTETTAVGRVERLSASAVLSVIWEKIDGVWSVPDAMLPSAGLAGKLRELVYSECSPRSLF